MRVALASLELPAPPGSLGALVAAPADEERYPGLLFYTDIFGRNPASVRAMVRFAGYGFTVVAPDLYRRIEPAGVALDFTADYDRAQRDAAATDAAAFDEDRRVAVRAMRAHPRVDSSPLACVGFCIGGHLALRAAVEPDVESVVAYYPTGVQDATLGASRDVDTLARIAASSARLFVGFGASDPHVDAAGRERIAATLGIPPGASETSGDSGATRRVRIFDGEHAFMRDEGPRYDPVSADAAFAEGLAWLRRRSSAS